MHSFRYADNTLFTFQYRQDALRFIINPFPGKPNTSILCLGVITNITEWPVISKAWRPSTDMPLRCGSGI